MKPELTHGGAVSWALGVMLAFWFVAQEVMLVNPRIAHDLVLMVGVQVVVYLAACALFSARRPGRSFGDLFALRRAPVLLCVAAAVLGLALRAPADYLVTLIEKVFPLPQAALDQLNALLVPKNFVHGVALAVVVGLAGPFVEELLYRGALFTALRAKEGAVAAATTTGILFVVIHLEPRFWPTISILAACLGLLRARSGSLWPGVLMHGVFNGTAVLMQFTGGKADEFALRPSVVGGSLLVAVLALFAALKLASSSAIAERARALDVRPAPEPGVPS